MNIIKYILILFFCFSFIDNVQAFMDSENKGAQGTGREDLSYLDSKNSNFKKGKIALKQALKFQKKNKTKKANKRFEDALEYFILAYKESSESVEILSYLGLTYNKVGDLTMSEIYYQEGLIIDPKNYLINQRLGELYFNTKRVNLAKERLEVLISCDCQEYLNLKNIIEKK